MLKLLQSLIRPRDAWAQCTPLTPAERLAEYEIRLGRDRARRRLRAAIVQQVIDHRIAERASAPVRPRLPA